MMNNMRLDVRILDTAEPIYCNLDGLKQYKNERLTVYAAFNEISVMGFCIQPIEKNSDICVIGCIEIYEIILYKVLSDIFISIIKALGYTHFVQTDLMSNSTNNKKILNMSIRSCFKNSRTNNYLYVAFSEEVE